MDIADVEENFVVATDAKLHGGMYKILSAIYCQVLAIFPGLEAARPRSKSGIQALCSLHVALEKTKNVLQHCTECSKLYLAITGDSVLIKFAKARSALIDSLRHVEDIVPQSMGCQIEEIVSELERTQFSLDSLEKQVGDGIIALLQQGRKFNSNSNEMNELEAFHQGAYRLGITSSKAALIERRALKRLIERARMEDDKRKESIVAFLLHLMRKYSKLFRSEIYDDNDSQGSAPCSPTVVGAIENGNELGGDSHAFERQFSRLSSFNFTQNNRRSEQMPFPPEELRCPISLQLMHDPVIISSGQTYERLCIEKWFSDGHKTCPKTQQLLYHIDLTPNYCVKGLISSWCAQNGVPIPDAPPDSLDLNYWRLALSECESTNSKSVDSIGSCKFMVPKAVSLEESGIIEESEGNKAESLSTHEEEVGINLFERYDNFLSIFNNELDIRKKCKLVEQIRHLLKDDEEARIFMGANGFVDVLMQFLRSAVYTSNKRAMEIGAMALFNLSVNNNRNIEMMLAAGVISLLEEMIADSNSHGSATALYLNLSCLGQAKPIISSSKAVPFFIHLLGAETNERCRLDSLHTLYNLSTTPSCIQNLISAGIVNGLCSRLTLTNDPAWTERSMAVLSNLAATTYGKDKMISNPDIITGLATILNTGGPTEQEQAVSCLLTLCRGNDDCSQMVLQEGVIPSLVSISVNGTMRGKEKAQKLLMLFREQRQRDSPPLEPTEQHSDESCDIVMPVLEQKLSSKLVLKRKVVGKALSFLWKSKASNLKC